jgi:hypothetical protein
MCDFPQCESVFQKDADFLVHKRGVHAGSDLWCCYICNKQFKDIAYVMRHMRRMHTKQQSADEEDLEATLTSSEAENAEEELKLVCKVEIGNGF